MAEEKGNSELTQEVEALKNVSKNLAELLTNSVNMVDKYYEIFFDQNPHYVKLEQYDKNGILHTTLVPNRAMDKSVALSGTEDPEGVVDALIGTLYVNSATRELFMKKTTKGNIGWVNITPQPIEIYKETFKVNSKTQTVSLLYKAYAKDYIDVFLNGIHLEQADYDLDIDQQTLIFNTQLSDDSTLQVSYMTGLYGIKGDTAVTFKIGKVRTVPTDELAKVKNVGTDEDIILDFDIPNSITGILPVGSEVAIPTSSNYVPEGCLLKDGSEYTKEQFPDLWENYLSYDVRLSDDLSDGIDWETRTVGSSDNSYDAIAYADNKFVAVGSNGQIATSIRKEIIMGKVLSLKTYADYEAQISEFGICESFGIDIKNEKFKVPYKVSSSVEKYYVSVANIQINQSQMDWSEWASSLQGKADKSTTYTKTEIDNIISSNLGNIETLLSEV